MLTAREEQNWSGMFAELANLPNWSALSPGQRLVMDETLAKLLHEPFSPLQGQRRLMLAKDGPAQRLHIDWEAVHQLIKSIVVDVVERRRVVLPLDRFSQPPVVVDEDSVEVFAVQDLVLLHLLLLLLRLPVPFLRCQHCKLIAPAGPKPNQGYCSPTCRSRAANAKRRGQPRGGRLKPAAGSTMQQLLPERDESWPVRQVDLEE